ncbi:MAG: hypothetical protein GX548_01105 [Lentisphaerae bacterium]|nr:hypothetical protein [Lentisphaerota bacterium]
MNGRRIGGMLARGILAALLAGVTLHLWPGAWLVPAGRLAGVLVERVCPWLDRMSVRVEGTRLQADGRIQVDMIQANGSPLPSAPGSWSKQAVEALALAGVALAAWAAAPVGRRRWWVLPVVLAAAVLLAVEILDAALEGIGYQWLPRFSFADTPANHNTFARLEHAYALTRNAKTFHDAGGCWFYGLLAGWIGFLIPLPGLRQESGSSGTIRPAPSALSRKG